MLKIIDPEGASVDSLVMFQGMFSEEYCITGGSSWGKEIYFTLRHDILSIHP